MEIRETSDYGMFKLHPANRIIDKKYVIKMAERMKKKFLLRSFPIVTDVNMYIMDGQTRYYAAELLKKPIYYVIDPDIVIEDVATLNHNKSWSLMDYVKSYKSLGNDVYKNIVDRVEREYYVNGKHRNLSLSTVLLFSTDCNISYAAPTRNGTIKINSDEEYNLQIKRAIDIYTELGCNPTENASRAFVVVIRNELYNHNTMLHKLRDVMPFKKFRVASSTKDNIRQLEEIYNYRSRKEQYVVFG